MSIGTPIPTAQAQLDPDDPWPKYAGDLGNTCYTEIIGPHAKPTLRWWARLSAPSVADPGMGDNQAPYYHGAAVGRLGANQERHVVVGARDSMVRVFRFQPTAWVENEPERLEAVPIATFSADVGLVGTVEVRSTPLILTSDRVVIQANRADTYGNPVDTIVGMWDLSDLSNITNVWWILLPYSTGAGHSPTTGNWYQPDKPGFNGAINNYVYCVAGGNLYCIDPDNQGPLSATNTQHVPWYAILKETDDVDMGATVPAVGPVNDDAADRNGVYVTLAYPIGAGEPPEGWNHFFALWADGDGYTGEIPGPRWEHSIALGPFMRIGTFASPSIHHGAGLSGEPIVASDDGQVYAFSANWGDTEHLRWADEILRESLPNRSFSATMGVLPDDRFLVWNESGMTRLAEDSGTHPSVFGGDEFQSGGSWIHGAPILNASRFYYSTPSSNGDGREANRVCARTYPVDFDPYDPSWTWGDDLERPLRHDPNNPGTLIRVPELPFFAPPAIDEDGTLLCVSFNYIYALRPCVADFDADEALTNFDIDAMALAYLDPVTWQQTYNANRLGIGDCNNDGAFDSFDLDCLSARILEGGHCDDMGAGARLAGENAIDYEYLCEVVAFLRRYLEN